MRMHPMWHLEATHFATWSDFPMGDQGKKNGEECFCDDERLSDVLVVQFNLSKTSYLLTKLIKFTRYLAQICIKKTLLIITMLKYHCAYPSSILLINPPCQSRNAHFLALHDWIINFIATRYALATFLFSVPVWNCIHQSDLASQCHFHNAPTLGVHRHLSPVSFSGPLPNTWNLHFPKRTSKFLPTICLAESPLKSGGHSRKYEFSQICYLFRAQILNSKEIMVIPLPFCFISKAHTLDSFHKEMLGFPRHFPKKLVSLCHGPMWSIVLINKGRK